MKKIIFILLTAFFIVSIFGSAYAAIKISKYNRSESSTTAGFSLIENEVYFNQLMELSNVSVKFTQDASNYIFNIKGNIALDVYNDVTHTTFYGSASALSPMLYKSENFGDGMYVNESSKVPYVDFVSGSLYSGSVVKILGEKVAWYNESYNQLSNGDVSNYVNDNDGNGDKYYIPNSLRNISSSSYNYRYATQYPICVKNNGTGVSILQNSSSHKFNTMSNGMVNNYTANVNIKISIKKSYIDDYRYICFAQSYFVNTEESFKELYDSVRGISLCTQTIDLKEYAECDHNWIITSVDETNHTKRCNDCEWEITEAHDLRYEYDGITKDLCTCGYKKQIYHHYVYNSSQMTDNKVKINVDGTYTKPNPTKTGYKIASIDRYFKYYSNMTNPVFSESNTSLTKTYVDNLTALPDNAAAYSTVFEWKYNPIKYKIHYNTVNNLGATISLSLSDINNCEYDKEYSLSSPVIAHYIFKGWTTTKGSSEVKVTTKAKNLTTTDGATVNLYPVLEYNDYTFKFSNENNLNLKLNGSIADLKCNSFTKYNLPNNIEVTGYTFLGWGLSKNNTVNFSPKAEIYNYTSDEHKKITLYPIYRVNKYKIHFDNENNLGATINLKLEDINNCEYNKEYSLSSPAISHYIFKGWTTTKGNSESNVAAKAKNLTSNDGVTVNLYPVLEYNDYTFHFRNENNLNLPLNEEIPEMKCYSYTKYNLPDNIAVTGHTFLGWGLATTSDIEFGPNEEIFNWTEEEHKDIVLYPLYRTNKYKVHFSAQNNMIPNISFDLNDLDCEYNSEYNLPNVKLVNYIFRGWSTEDKNEIEFKLNDKIRNLSSDDNDVVNLYPVFDINYYIMHFSKENNRNLEIDEEIDDLKCNANEKYVLSNHIDIDGYIFNGWSLTKDGIVTFEPNAQLLNYTTEENKEYTLYPNYTPIEYTIKYSNENMQNVDLGNNISDQSYVYDEPQNLKDNIEINGYEFKGWSTNLSSEEVELKPNENVLNYTNENNKVITIYPVYTPAQFKIIYNTYDGQYSNGKNSIAKEYSILTTKDFEIPKIKDIDHYNKYDELYAKEIAVFDKYIDDDDAEYNSIQDIINNVISDNTYYASYNLTCNYHLEKKYFSVQDRDSGSSATGKIPGIITDEDIFNRERESLANAENEKNNEIIVNTIKAETKVEADNIAKQKTEGMLNNLLNNVILLYQNTKEKLLDEKSKLSSEDGEVQAHSVTETEEEAPYIKNAIDISDKKIRSNSDSAKNISASKFQLFLLGLIKHKEIVILTLSSELALLFIYVLYRRRKERSNTSEE